MLALRNPGEAYRRVDFDARVVAAAPHELVQVCYEQLTAALGAALLAAERGDNRGKSAALTRALAALTALELGVDPQAQLSAALTQLYQGARRTVLDSVLCFSPPTITALRSDFADIARALCGDAITSVSE